MKPSTCVITLGVAETPPADHPQIVRDFRPAIARLEASLSRQGYEGDFASWENEYPAGSPSHFDSPCGFKPFCFLEAAAKGYELVLWLDATVEAIRPIDLLFDQIAHDGYLFFAEEHSVGEFCKDDALATLGITREASFTLPSCWACAIGLDLRQERSRRFLDRWKTLALDGITFPGPRWSGLRGFPATASTDPRVHGHRYDQTAASVIAWQLDMRRWAAKSTFGRFFKNHRRAVPTLAASAAAAARLSAADKENPSSPATRPRVEVLFFSRGRGRGHAVPDLAIAEELSRLTDRVAIHFASYATGADTFREAGWPVFDLEMAEVNPYTRTLLRAHALIQYLRPALVIAHEEFAALPAAHLTETPCVLITDWFPPASATTAETIPLADSIVFIGDEGGFPLPESIRCAPTFVGPVVRRMKYSLSDRSRARAELGLPENATVVSVIPGAWATEARAPIADLVLPAFDRLPAAKKYLFWLTKADHAAIARQAAHLPGMRVLGDCAAVEQIMVASDVILTKGNRGTTLDAASLGVPSISLSAGTNPVDDAVLTQVRSNRALNVKATDAAALCTALEELCALPLAQRHPPLNLHLRGGEAAAKALWEEIQRLLPEHFPPNPK
jgi:UDP:flavonoid glycosyltransferase YjiC (YdhE family)